MKKQHDFGHVEPSSNWNVIVEFSKVIHKAVPSCGCIGCSVKGNELQVELKAPEFPFHIRKDFLIVNKNISITFVDQSITDFAVRATVLKPKK